MLTIAALLVAAVATAGPVLPAAGQTFNWNLYDHAQGLLVDTHGPYGLRYDSLASPLNRVHGPTFSFERNGAAMSMSINDVGDATFGGTLWRNDLGQMFTAQWNLTGLVQGTTHGGYEFTGGFGTLVGPGVNLSLTGKQDADGRAFIFAPNGHGLDNDDTTWVGLGWLNMLANGDGTDGEPFPTNDWKFTAGQRFTSCVTNCGPPSVPEPTMMTLFGLGLITLAFRMRAWHGKYQPKRK